MNLTIARERATAAQEWARRMAPGGLPEQVLLHFAVDVPDLLAEIERLSETPPDLLDAHGTRWTWMTGYQDEDGNGMASRAAIEDDEDARPVVEVAA